MENFQESENHCARQESASTAERYHSRSYVEEVRKQVRPAEMRLKWVEQQISALLAERVDSITQMSTSDRLEGQAKLPKRTSKSGQTTLKDLNRDKNNIRASANSALGPIHPLRVSKTAEKKAPCRRRQFNMLAEHRDGQNQDSDPTISPLLPANVAPRRSSRLSNNEKTSGALEPSSAVDRGESVRSPPIILRKSDRISKRKERMSTSTSSAAVMSAVFLHTDPLRRRSKPKGRLAGNTSVTSLVKPRGISKREESNSSRNKTKIHS